jgi:Flagellar L-ring protein
VMAFRQELVISIGVAFAMACLAPRVDATEPQPIKVHDAIVVTVKETAQPRTNSTFPQFEGASVADDGTVTYRVTAVVVDALPDGMLLIEARKLVPDDKHPWKYTLTGKIRRQDISPNRNASSERISDLQISKVQDGEFHDSTKRSWFARLWHSTGLTRDTHPVETP